MSSQQINLNFQVVPTAQGPKIIQKGVTVQPGALDNLFAQLKYQNIPRPVSARVRHDSFTSTQSWDGAAHLRYAAYKLNPIRGDNPGLGRHYNPVRNRRRNSAQRPAEMQNSGGRRDHSCTCSHPSLDEHPNDYVRRNQPELNISNVDTQTQRDSGAQHPFIRIDAHSKTDIRDPETSNENAYGQVRGRAQQMADSRSTAAYNASISPERDSKPTQNLPQYQLQKQRAGAGMASTESMRELAKGQVSSQPLLQDAGGQLGNPMMDIGCSRIDKLYDDHRVPDDQDHPDLSESFSKDAGQFCHEYKEEQRKKNFAAAVNGASNAAKQTDMLFDVHGPADSNTNMQDLVTFKQKLNENRMTSWTEEEVQRGYPDTMSFAPANAPSINNQATAGNGINGGIRSTEQSCNSPAPLGTTPAFERSIKSNTKGNAVLENVIGQESVGAKIASTQRESNASSIAAIGAKTLQNSLHETFAAQLLQTSGANHRASAQQHQEHGDDGYFYNLDGQVGLFTERAGQTSSTKEGLVTSITKDQQTPQQNQQQQLHGYSENEPVMAKQDSIASQLVWQASLPPELGTQSTNELKVVSEEDPSHLASKISTPLDKNPDQINQNSSASRTLGLDSTKTATRTALKRPTLLMTSKKGKKKSTKPTSLTGTMMPLPALNTSRPMTGRMSPSMTKVESVKSGLSLKQTSTSASKPPRVLMSNAGMASVLPKSIHKVTNKKGSAERPKKKQPSLSQAKKPTTVTVVDAKNTAVVLGQSDKEFEELLQTPKNVMTPPNLEPSVSAKAKKNVPIGEISLVSVLPASAKSKHAPSEKMQEESKLKKEDLEIKLANSEFITHQDLMEDISPTMGFGLLSEKGKAHASQSFTHNSNIDIADQSTPAMHLTTGGTTSKNQRRSKGERGLKMNNSRNVGEHASTSSRSPTKSTRELQVLEIPKEYDMESDHVVEYMLGDKAKEIEAPLYQVNIANKLVYSLTQLNGEDPPPFIKLVENKLGRKVIRIRQKETTGVQQLYQLKLDVRNPETNVSGSYKCRVFIRPGVKLLLKKALFSSPVEYSIKGPAAILQMPVYSAKHDDLDFFLERVDQGDLPSFIRVSRDSNGNRVIKLQGNHINEIGIYQMKLITRDKITKVLNDEFQFTVIGTPGIEVKHLPKEYEEEIKVDPTQTCIQLAMPTFNLETVKEEEAMPLEYSLVMKDGSKVPDFIFIKILADGNHIIELKAADLPPGLNTVFEVQLKVYDPNSDATQLIPISVKCPEPNLMLCLKQTNFPEEIQYSVGSKEIFVKVPEYERNDGLAMQEPVLLTLGGKESKIVSRIAQVYTSESGEQFIKVQTFDSRMKGTYEVKVYATEQNSGLTNQDAFFKLVVKESVLTLMETPNVCFLGKPLLYQPKGPPTYVPLPQYSVQRAQIKFSLASRDALALVPPFVRIQGDYMVVEGTQNPTMRDYHLKLLVFDPVSESKDELECQITSNIYEIVLERVPFNSPVEFRLGDELTLPMPIYKEVPFSGELTYGLEIQGAGMMLAGIELASIVFTDNGEPMIKIAGGKNSNKGTYQITVCVTEKTLGVSNKEAVFMLEAKPQLKLLQRPAEFDAMPPMQVDQVYKLPLPTYATKKRLRYQIYEKGTDDEQSCPSFISVKCPKQAQPYIEVKCQQHGLPSKSRYDFELITCENQQHNVENVQEFSLEFDIQPRCKLRHFEVECPIRYCIGQGSLAIPLPVYDCYIVEASSLDMQLISDYTERPIPFAVVDKASDSIVINTDNAGFEGLHDISVVATNGINISKLATVRNEQAKFRVEIAPAVSSIGDANSPSLKTVSQGNCFNTNERSSETLPIQDVGSEELHVVKNDDYGPAGRKHEEAQGRDDRMLSEEPQLGRNEEQEQHLHQRESHIHQIVAPTDQEMIGDKISKIEENEEIPIYYSDQSIDDKLPITPRNADLNPVDDHVQEAKRQSGKIKVYKNGKSSVTQQPTEGSSPREKLRQHDSRRARQMAKSTSRPRDLSQASDVVVTADAAIQITTGQASVNHHRGDHDGSRRKARHFDHDNIIIDDENAATLPQEQIEMLLRENEEIRRQIAEVKNQMDQSMTMARAGGGAHPNNQNANLSHQNLSPIRSNANGGANGNQQHRSQQLNSPEALASQLHASMQLLTQHQQNQQTYQHQQQQQANMSHTNLNLAGLLANSLDEAYLQEEAILNNQLRQRIEQSKLRQMQQMNELERMRNEVNQGQASHQQQLLNHYLTETNGQGREKDVRLRQLRTQLAQLQEQRANLRKQCTTLKQREDDLQSELITKDQQLKQLTKRNEEQSTKASSVFSEIDKVIYRNENLRAEVQSLEEQLDEKKQVVNRSKARLRDLNGTQTELEDKITSQKHRFNKLRVEMESVKRRLDHEESMAAVRMAETHSANENLQTATFSPQRQKQQRKQQQQARPKIVSPEYEMPEQIQQTMPHSARAQNSQYAPFSPPDQMQPNNYGPSSSYQQQAQYGSPQRQGFNPITGMPYGAYQPQDVSEMPAAGMPSERRSLNSNQGAIAMSTPRQHMRHPANMGQQYQGYHHPPGQYSYSAGGSSEKKITNPRPAKPIRPKENNIFGGGDEFSSPHRSNDDQMRFQTTYTQFANREKFRGHREGEDGGLRVNNIVHHQPWQPAPQRMFQQPPPQRQLPHSQQYLPQQHNVQEPASGMPTDYRRQKELQNAQMMPQNHRDYHNYEKKYRY